MKHALLLLYLAASPFTFSQVASCGDGQLYAWQKQTSGDSRFATFPALTGKKSGPAFDGGDKALDALIRKKLTVTAEAQQHVFNLNYYFTVGCDGTVSDLTFLGDPVVAGWTNLEEILSHTSGWKPAQKDEKPVDCIYFRTLLIDGKNYPLQKDW